MTYFHAVYPALSSARRRFTVLFGMGRRGTNALCSSEKTAVGPARKQDQPVREEVKHQGSMIANLSA